MSFKLLEEQITAAVRDIKEHVQGFAEQRERLARVAEDFGTASRKMTTRAGCYVHEGSGGVEELREAGCRSIKDFQGKSAFLKDEHGRLATTQDGQVVRGISADAEGVLRLHDAIHIVDILAKTGKVQGLHADDYRNGFTADPRGNFIRHFPELGKTWDQVVQAAKATTLTTGGSSTGADWIPTVFSATLFDDVRLACPELNLFGVLPQPSKTWTLPLKASTGSCSIRTEGTAPAADVMGTSSVSLTAKTFVVYEEFTDEMDQDSAIAMANSVREDVVQSLAEGLSVAIVSGDVTTTHMHNDLDTHSLGANHPGTGFNGLEHYGLVDQTGSQYSGAGAALTAAKVAAMVKLGGKYFAGRAKDAALLLSPSGYMDLLTEADSPLLKRNEYGPGATIVTGELFRIYGIRCLLCHGISERSENVSASGLNTLTGPNTFYNCILTNTRQWVIGDRQDVRLETDRNIAAGETLVVGTARWGFGKLQNASGKNHTIIGFNFT